MHPPPNISGSLHDRPLPAALARGHSRPLAPHAGLQHALPARLRPRRYLDLGLDRPHARAGGDGASATSVATASTPTSRSGCERYGGTIMSQFRQLGASLDYRRTRFTMDEDYYRAVILWFVHLYERGWIYRANRIVNWCPRDQTALSDLEVEHEDEDDTLSYLPLSARRRLGPRDDRDGAAGNDPRGCRGRGSSRRRAVPRPRRQEGRRPLRRAARAGHRRRAGGARVRYRRAQDHAGPRSAQTSRSAATTASPSSR